MTNFSINVLNWPEKPMDYHTRRMWQDTQIAAGQAAECISTQARGYHTHMNVVVGIHTGSTIAICGVTVDYSQ